MNDNNPNTNKNKTEIKTLNFGNIKLSIFV